MFSRTKVVSAYVLVFIALSQGSILSTGAQDARAIITPENSGDLVQTGWVSRGWINEITWIPDGGEILISATTGTWLLDTESRTRKPEILSPYGKRGLIGPDGQMLVALDADSQKTSLWNVTEDAEFRRLPLDVRYADSIAFSPDGALLVVGGWMGNPPFGIQVFDLSSDNEALILQGPEGYVTELAFSENGEWLYSAATDATVRMWDTSTGTERAVIQFGAQVHHVVQIPHTQTIAAGGHTDRSGYGDPTSMAIWDPSSGEYQALLDEPVSDIDVSVDGTTLAACASGKLYLWDVATLARLEPEGIGRCESVSFKPHSTVLAISSGTSIDTFDYTTLKVQTTFGGFGDSVASMALSPDNALLAASTPGDIQIYRYQDFGQRGTLTGGDRIVRSLAFSPDGTLLAGGGTRGEESIITANSVRVWDVTAFEPVAVLLTDYANDREVAFSRDGKLLAATTARDQLRAWAVGPYTEYDLVEDPDCVSLALSPADDLLACGHSDNTIHIWNLRAWEYTSGMFPEMAVLSGHGGAIDQLVFSPDGTLLASASQDGSIRLWNLTTLTSKIVWQVPSDQYASLTASIAFSPDGTILVTSLAPIYAAFAPSSVPIDYSVVLSETLTGNKLVMLEHNTLVTDIAFSPDGKSIVTGAVDGGIRVWSLP